MRNRVIGAVKGTSRPEMAEEEETASAQQLSLLDSATKKKRKGRSQTKKRTKR